MAIAPMSATPKLAPGDADVGVEVGAPHDAAGDHRQVLGLVAGAGKVLAELVAEELADLVALEVHRREDEVVRRLGR